MKSFEWKWGCLIGLANVAWLVASWAAGWHAKGIGMIQVTVFLAMALTFVGYALAMRSILKREPETTVLEGLRSGALIAVVAALIAVGGQFAYFHWINPGWTDYMVGETRRHYESLGVEEARIAEIAEGAKTTFGFGSYAIEAAAGAIVQGVVFSAVTFAFQKWLANR
jgi:hypothetical protein